MPQPFGAGIQHTKLSTTNLSQREGSSREGIDPREDIKTTINKDASGDLTNASNAYLRNKDDINPISEQSQNRKSRGENRNTNSFTNSFNILQWNGRSLQSNPKVAFLKGINWELCCLQEIWQHEDQLQNLGNVLATRIRTTKRGGGSSTIHSSHFKILKEKEIVLNKDSLLLKIRIENSHMWIGNIYIPNKSLKKIIKIFCKIRQNVPSNEWASIMLLGDFNMDINKQDSEEYKNFKSLCKSIGLTITPPLGNTRGDACLDFAVIGSNVAILNKMTIPSPSDHKAISWEVKVKSPNPKSKIKIPNKKLAEETTARLFTRFKDLQELYQNLSKIRHDNQKRLNVLLKPKKKDTSLLDKLLEVEESTQIQEIISNHWTKEWEDLENKRYSPSSAEAYKKLRTLTKYHLYEKKDGAVISQLLDDDDTVLTDRLQVESKLAKTIEEIQVDPHGSYIEKKPFPKLPELTAKEFTALITNQLSCGKAIAFDCLSDSIFQNKIDTEVLRSLSEEEVLTRNPPAGILKSLWNSDLDKLPGFGKTWEYRLCALNKVFPKIPKRTEMRPISISSPILKTLECRFLPSLQEYLNYKSDRAQTGFVGKMGTFVNLWRAIDRIQVRTHANKPCYGLFIDFSNAYNMIPHNLLFAKLRRKNILSENEIQFLEQIYSRIRIRIGKHVIRPNRGVAQGSVISPALFNIFIEDLSVELQREANINLEDLLFYADDLMAICSSPEQLATAIKIIKRWSNENGMVLNAKKSGIVVFANRFARDIPWMKKGDGDKSSNMAIWTPTMKEFEGIPICSKYKYLGTWLDNKLSVDMQISHIKKKSGHILTKLYPYLVAASADARRDMWSTMVRPLFGAVLPILDGDKTKRAKNKVLALWRKTFKGIMLLPARTPTILVNKMMGKGIMDICYDYF